jgi:hypothetical protein
MNFISSFPYLHRRTSASIPLIIIPVPPSNTFVVKWENVEPRQNVFNFGPVDEILDFANSVNGSVRGHTFMW